MEHSQISLLPTIRLRMTLAPNLVARKKILLISNVSLRTTSSSRSHLTNPTVNNTVLYLSWSDFPDNSTRDIGTIAFVLISSQNDVLSPDSLGPGLPANDTLFFTIWNSTVNGTLSKLHTIYGGSEALIDWRRR
jgi:hypothetical protein